MPITLVLRSPCSESQSFLSWDLQENHVHVKKKLTYTESNTLGCQRLLQRLCPHQDAG
jgi:hypothetical protein